VCTVQVCHISYIIRFGRGNFSETSKITGKSLPSRIDWVNLKCICSACFNSIFKNLFDQEQLWCLIAQPKRCFMQIECSVERYLQKLFRAHLQIDTRL
jgi:hypothetical protein